MATDVVGTAHGHGLVAHRRFVSVKMFQLQWLQIFERGNNGERIWKVGRLWRAAIQMAWSLIAGSCLLRCACNLVSGVKIKNSEWKHRGVWIVSSTWEGIMLNSIRSVGYLSIIYYMSLIIFGQIILLKLFLAVLLDNYDSKRKDLIS